MPVSGGKDEISGLPKLGSDGALVAEIQERSVCRRRGRGAYANRQIKARAIQCCFPVKMRMIIEKQGNGADRATLPH